MRVLVIENYPKTTLGLVGAALDEAGAEARVLRTHLGDGRCRHPPNGFDALVMLGGAQRCARRRRPSLSAGARRRSPAPSARPTRRCSASASAHSSSPAATARRTFSAGRSSSAGTRCARPRPAARDPVLAAIGEGCADFPLASRHLHAAARRRASRRRASSTEMQAFRVGRAVYGIQFHFEAGPNSSQAGASDFARARSPSTLPTGPNATRRRPPATARKADAAGLALARAWVALIRSSPPRCDGRRLESPAISNFGCGVSP